MASACSSLKGLEKFRSAVQRVIAEFPKHQDAVVSFVVALAADGYKPKDRRDYIQLQNTEGLSPREQRLGANIKSRLDTLWARAKRYEDVADTTVTDLRLTREAQQQFCRVAILGAGPGGLAHALAIAKACQDKGAQNVDIVVYEKRPEPTRGVALTHNSATKAYLLELGIPESFFKVDNTTAGCSERIELCEIEKELEKLCKQAGVRVVRHCNVSAIQTTEDNKFSLSVGSEKEPIQANIVIDASGLRSRKTIGTAHAAFTLPPVLHPQVYEPIQGLDHEVIGVAYLEHELQAHEYDTSIESQNIWYNVYVGPSTHGEGLDAKRNIVQFHFKNSGQIDPSIFQNNQKKAEYVYETYRCYAPELKQRGVDIDDLIENREAFIQALLSKQPRLQGKHVDLDLTMTDLIQLDLSACKRSTPDTAPHLPYLRVGDARQGVHPFVGQGSQTAVRTSKHARRLVLEWLQAGDNVAAQNLALAQYEEGATATSRALTATCAFSAQVFQNLE